MNLQEMIGGLVNQVSGKQQTEAETGGGSGLLGSVLGTAVSSSGGAQLAERLNQATSFLAPEQKREMVGGLLGKLGVSGAGAQALLQQLGINPAVADNPHEATPDELARLAQHAENNSESAAADDSSDASEIDAAADNDNREANDVGDAGSESDDDLGGSGGKN